MQTYLPQATILKLLFIFFVTETTAFANTKKKVDPFLSHLVFDKPIRNLGKVFQGEKKEVVFRFTTIGSEAVEVLGLSASCGCTVPKIDKRLYNAGDRGEILVVFDSSSFMGSLTKNILVMTKTKEYQDEILTIHADIIPEFLVDPPVLDFGVIRRAFDFSRRLQVKISPVNKNLTIDTKKMVYDRDHLQVAGSKVADSWILVVTLSPGIKQGTFRESLYIPTNSLFLPRIAIPVLAEMKALVSYEPRIIDFGQLRFERVIKRSLKLKGAKPFAIVSYSADAMVNGEPVDSVKDLIKVETVDGNTYTKEKRLTISVNNVLATYSGALHGQVHFKTIEPEENITIDLYGLLLERKGEK